MARAKRRVFISAAAADAPRVRELTERLRAARVDAWTSAVEALPGANVFAELGKAIKRADAIVVCVSPAAMKSRWVHSEIQFALGDERFENRLIPFMLKPTPADQIPWILRNRRWVSGDPDKAAKEILAILNTRSRDARAEAV